MDLGQDLRQVAVALVGDDDRRPGLGDEEVGAGDADIGREIFLPQHGAGFLDEGGDFGQVAVGIEMGVGLAEIGLDLIACQVHGGRDDVARPLVPDLDQVFAEIGLDRLDAVRLEVVVEVDLFRDHRLALGDELRIRLPADGENLRAGLFRVLRPVHVAAGLLHLLLVALEVDVEMVEHVVLDVAGLVAQRVELGQRVAGLGALLDEARAGLRHRILQLRVGQRLRRRWPGMWRLKRPSFGLRDRRRCHVAGEHLGDVAHLDGRALALQLARHVHQAAEVAGDQRVGACRIECASASSPASCRRCRDT